MIILAKIVLTCKLIQHRMNYLSKSLTCFHSNNYEFPFSKSEASLQENRGRPLHFFITISSSHSHGSNKIFCGPHVLPSISLCKQARSLAWHSGSQTNSVALKRLQTKEYIEEMGQILHLQIIQNDLHSMNCLQIEMY